MKRNIIITTILAVMLMVANVTESGAHPRKHKYHRGNGHYKGKGHYKGRGHYYNPPRRGYYAPPPRRAAPAVSINIGYPPPPVARPRYYYPQRVWVPGYWTRGHSRQWVPGHYRRY